MTDSTVLVEVPEEGIPKVPEQALQLIPSEAADPFRFQEKGL
jgi:hypothetical protein